MPIKGLKGGVGTKALGYGLGAAQEETEPNFNQTVLLLHGDGSEGAGNTAVLGDPNFKAFKDASTSTHAIVVNGDAYGNDFSPYYYADGYWSNSFDADSDSFEITNSADFKFGTGDFTIECWLYPHDAVQQSYGVVTKCAADSNWVDGWAIVFQNAPNNDKISFWINNAQHLASGTALNVEQWNHIAVSRTGSTTNLYQNGTRVATGTSSYDFQPTQALTIASDLTHTSYEYDGYISNLRILKGTAQYTGASYTVPTTPLTAIANTKLLTCQSNRFVDNSTSGHSISIGAGTPKVSTNTPFTQSKTANVGSGFFDGSGDYLAIGDNSAFAFGTGDFTIEGWIYTISTGTVRHFYDQRAASTDGDYPTLRMNTSNVIEYIAGGSVRISSSALLQNTWYHFAVTRSGSSTKLFVNGTQDGSTYSDSTNYLCGTGRPYVGGSGYHGSTLGFNGYISDLRVVNGTAVYSSGFTPPTTSLTAVTNTKLLTTQYSGAVRNVGFVDDSKYNHQITRNGDVAMGTFSPFSLEEGYWSDYFDGDAYHLVPDSDEHNFGTGDFTIEMFIYLLETPGHFILLSAPNGTTTQFGYSSTKYLHAYINNSDTIRNTDGVPSNSLILNQWNHIVLERSGTNLSILSNGTRHATVTFSGTVDFSNLNINRYHGGGAYDSVSYISNLRFVKGSVVYDSDSYTVPTAPLTAISGTTLLTCQSNRFIDNSTTGHTITPYNGAKVLPFSPFAPSRSYSKDAVGGSAFSDSSGDYLQLTDTNFSNFDFGTGPFLIEGWIYYTTVGTTILGQTGWGNVLQRSSNVFQFYQAASSGDSGAYWITGTTTLKINEWTHFAIQRDGSGNLDLWVNGSRDATNTTYASTAMKFHSSKGDITLRYWNGGASSAEDYISNFRIKNSAVYTSGATITVPTAPFTADANTVLLLNNNNAGIIDHTMKNNLETEANTRVSGQQIKFGTGSIYFDGTDDKIVLPHQEYHQLGKGEFTVELFVYFTSTNQRQGFFGNDTGWYFQIYDGELEFALSTSAIIERSFSHSINQWYHLAATRDSSNDIRLFIDGTQQGAVVNSTADLRHASNNFHIGNIGPSTSRPFAGGYMDEIRITKGVARYTSNFTVPTKAFANR